MKFEELEMKIKQQGLEMRIKRQERKIGEMVNLIEEMANEFMLAEEDGFVGNHLAEKVNRILGF